ncbi:hypothetical protein CISIN_1g045200mg [Citrus sinensis]|uniref:Uncharacterized protein n=1 Tax=Citrus sinensis TaxID=2711 RepID=A0A067GL24_CITSI|nr:hypothetical protein CISIN_1g045200mg [Citrus sinensis]
MATERRACLPTLCTFCLLNARWCSVNLDSSFVCSQLLIHSARHLDLLEVGPLVKGQREPWSDKSGKRLRWGCTEEESDADMTRPKSEGRPNNCTPRCPDTMILSSGQPSNIWEGLKNLGSSSEEYMPR